MTKPYEISKNLGLESYQTVKAKGGSAGVDQESIQAFENNLKSNLYKLWNRLSSGSYFPPPVKGVSIPKKGGGIRMLGVPTVADRIAQTVVKKTLEPLLEPLFHQDSYGYRPGRSALDAVGVVRERCWKYDWVVEFDISQFFDTMNHELLMRAVRKHCQIPWVLLYVERWLKAPMVNPAGELRERTTGTPQGGVVSPLLANLFLHYAFDRWVSENLPGVPFCRYADDGVLHCKSKVHAELVMQRIVARFDACRLRVNSDKTRIIYCKDVNRKEDHQVTSFTFLGYTFRPRRVKGKYGRIFVGFTPAVSQESLKTMRNTIRGWHLQLKSNWQVQELSKAYNPVLRGWKNYFCRFNATSMTPVWHHVNLFLSKWLMRKHQKLAGRLKRTLVILERIARANPDEFVHWKFGYIPKGWIMGAG
jgi:RNA-directed DNA polymerase